MKTILFSLYISIFLVVQLFSQDPGTLDPSFGDGGKLFIECTDNSGIYDMQVLQDGRILAAGECTDGFGSSGMIVMLNPDGTVDTDFGEDGFVYITFPDYSFVQVDKIILSGPGEIIALMAATSLAGDHPGNAERSGDEKQGIFMKMDTQGTYLSDPITFGPLTANVGVRIDEQDRVVIASNNKSTSGPDFRGKVHIRRFTPSLTPDVTFGIGGLAEFADGSGNDFDYVAGYLDYLLDGRLVVMGHVDEGLDQEPLALVLDGDGSPDPSFGVQGYYLGDYNTSTVIRSGAVLPGGDLIMAGSIYNLNTSVWDQGMIKININTGSPDPGFGNNGVALNDIFDADLNDLVVQDDGRLVAFGVRVQFKDSPGSRGMDFFLSKYLPDGSVDGSFGDNGSVTLDFGFGFNFAKDVKLQADGNILAGGFADIGGKQAMALARYNNDVSISVEEGNLVGKNIHIYPNPASEQVHIELPGAVGAKYTVGIINDLGQLLNIEDIANTLPLEKHTIDLDGLSPGLYTIIVRGEGAVYTERLVIN